jgi:hypothetical protein
MASLDITDDLYAQLAARAEIEGKSVDKLAAESLRESLKQKRWQAMFSINKRPAMNDSEIVDAVHDYRAGR